MDDFEPKDIGRVRSLELDNNKVNITRRDPYGFWHISLDKGQIPEHLKGAYTSYPQAEEAAIAYYTSQKREAKPLTK